MSLLTYLKNLLTSSERPESPPAEYCPNCWGEQEYDGKIHEIVEKERINFHNVEERLGWIEAYVIENFEGIKLEDEDGRKVCPHCNTRF